MTHFITGDDKLRDLTYDDAYRSYLITRSDSADDYRFARSQPKRTRIRARNALRRINGYLKSMIEAIADSKIRRMQRELQLRGIWFEPSRNEWMTRTTRPTERSR